MADAKATAPAAPRWPGETRAACAFTFDMDAETLWMARDIHEPVALSQGRFGPIEALPRILALLEKAEVRASFFIPAWVASHYADAVRAIASAGHEIGCHGDLHERVSDLDPKQEEAILEKSLEVLTPLAGRRPVGWRAPAWQLSAKSLELVAKHGFEYSSNMMDRLAPYLHPETGGRALFQVHGTAEHPGAGAGVAGLDHRVRRHHRGPRRHQLHLPPADHRQAVAPRLPAGIARPRQAHAARLDRAARRDRRPLAGDPAGLSGASRTSQITRSGY